MRASSTSTVRRLAGAVLALAAIAPVVALAGAEARGLLARMSETMRSATYQGTLVYQQGDRIDSMSLVHGWLDGREHERLRTQTGEPFEVIRVGDSVTCVWPADRRALITKRAGKVSPLRSLTEFAQLPRMYSAEVLGDARVAGRGARIVEIRAHDEMRYGYRMWIDPESHLLLRADMVGADGRPLERILFTEIELLERVSPVRFEPSLEGVEYTAHSGSGDDSRVLERPAWVTADLPTGFRAVSHVRRRMPPHGDMVQQSVYSDGLASVSVFVEPSGSDTASLEGASRMGAVHAYGRRADGHRITVVGEVPPATVRAIAEAVRRREAG